MIETHRPFAHALADRYEVERPLGRGGMATVYLAEDLKHHRKVAVKVLRPELAAALGEDRFLREIEIAAKLNHPHILALYDSGAVDGLLFYVMPHISGESLRQKLERERQLSIDETLRITAHVASALDHAHARGLIHRDIKPENILIHEGEALVADFGIALAVNAAGTERLTQVGMSLGTPEYMSPEQAAGEPEIDARSDVYSLGCVCYEMLAGEPPYTGTARALIVKHLVDPVPGVRRLRDAIPAGIEQALTRALAKAPADRFPSAGEFATALTKGSAGAPSLRSIAVLPFVNLSADADNEYFADGVTEDVITQLSKIRALKVVSRTSVMPFKKRDVNLREVAAQLGVSTIVEGSVRRAGNRVRVVAQLIDAETDEHLWAETYDRDLNDIFAIQSDLALQIASALEAVLTPDERARIEKAPTGGPPMSLGAAFITRALPLEATLDKTVQAYQACLKGRFHWYKLTPEDLDKALEYYELSVEEDPEFAPAHVGIAQVWAGRAALGADPPHEVMPKAKAAAQRALELDATLGEAHDVVALALVWYDYDWAAGELEFRRAIELNPGYAHSHLFYALFLNSMRRWEEAKVLTERALELDPNNPFFKSIAGVQLMHRRRYDEAIAQITESLPDLPTAHWGLWIAFHATRRYDDALAEAREWLSRASARVPEAGEALVRGHAHGGYQAAMRAAAEALGARSHQMYVDPHLIAQLYACADDRDETLRWLERAYDAHCSPMVYLAVHPVWDAIRDDSRFQSLVRRMRLPT